MKGNDSRRAGKGIPKGGTKGKKGAPCVRAGKGKRGKGKTKGKAAQAPQTPHGTNTTLPSPPAHSTKGAGSKGVKGGCTLPLQAPAWLTGAPAESAPCSFVDLMRQRDPFWHGDGACSSKFRLRTEGCYPIQGSLWGTMSSEAPGEIAQHQAALAKLFPLHAYHSALLSASSPSHPGHQQQQEPKRAPAAASLLRADLLGAERSLVINVATSGHFRTLGVTAVQLVQAVASGFFASSWSEARHSRMPSWLKHRLSAALISVPLPWDVQRELGRAFWESFGDTEPMQADTLAALQQCIPSDEEFSTVEAHLHSSLAGNLRKLGGAEQFVHLLGSTPEFVPWFSFLQLRADMRALPEEISLCFQGQATTCQLLLNSRPVAVVLQLVLAVGNCLNRSQASGFELESLKAAGLTKARGVPGSMVHYVAVLAAELLCDGDLKQLRALFEAEVRMLGAHSHREVFEGSRREMGDLQNRMAMLQASPQAHRVAHLLDSAALLQLQSLYHTADSSLHALRRFFSSSSSGFDLLECLRDFFRLFQDCCTAPATAKMAALCTRARPLEPAVSHRRFNWSVVSVDAAEPGLWQSPWILRDCSPEHLLHRLQLDAALLFALSSQRAPAPAAAPGAPVRALECDTHLLGIKLGSRRLLSRGREVARALEALEEASLGPEDLAVVLHAFPTPGDRRTLDRAQMLQAIHNWCGVRGGCKPLSPTELFMWRLSKVAQGAQRAELLLNLRLLPERANQLVLQVQVLQEACHNLLSAEEIPRVLRLVRLVGSVLNQERIKGFCLASLASLQDTRCVTTQGTLESYLAYAAPRVGLDLELAAMEIARCAGIATHPVEGLQGNLSKLTYMARASFEILKRLPEDSQVQAAQHRLHNAAVEIEALAEDAEGVLGCSGQIQSMFPGSGSATHIVGTLKSFLARVRAPEEKAQQAIAEMLQDTPLASLSQ